MTATPLIAIVDDDASVRDAMGRLVRSFDMAVSLFASGTDLLDAVAREPFACIITDVQMPGMTGFAMCDALQARGITVPVIFMTAFADEGYEQRARAVGASCFLYKPFRDTDILHCIEHALSSQA